MHQITSRIYQSTSAFWPTPKNQISAESRVKFSRYADACSFVLGRNVVWLGRRYVWIYSNGERYPRERCLPRDQTERIFLTMFVDGRLFAAPAREALWFLFFLFLLVRCIAVVPGKDAKYEKEIAKNELLLKMELYALSTEKNGKKFLSFFFS